MLFEQHAGLPHFTPYGFDVHPPNIPDVQSSLPSQTEQAATLQEVQFHLSLATLNVGSLFVGPDGFGGKLSFLRGQVQSHALNIVGIQEARSPAGMSIAEDVLATSKWSRQGQVWGGAMGLSCATVWISGDRAPPFQKIPFPGCAQ